MIPTCPVRESVGSRAGQKFLVADGNTVPNLGEKRLTGQSEFGDELSHTYQMADMTCPLTSVGDICDEEKVVMFGPRGGVVIDMATNSMIPFPRENGRYKWNIWINAADPELKGVGQPAAQTDSQSGFGRRGR